MIFCSDFYVRAIEYWDKIFEIEIADKYQNALYFNQEERI
jgi:hypothetical protein